MRSTTAIAALLCCGCATTAPSERVETSAPAVSSQDAARDPDAFALEALDLCDTRQDLEARRRGLTMVDAASAAQPDVAALQRAAARCGFAVAELERDPDVIEAAAQRGMDAAQRLGADSDPEAAYLSALCLGLLMRIDMSAAVSRVPEMQARLKIAGARPELDQGGPLRVLGMLYLRAPPWPASVGDLELALELLEQAAQRFPAHPQNHLFHAQALLEDDEQGEAATALTRAQEALAQGDWGAAAPRWRQEIESLRKRLHEAEGA